MFEVAVDRTRNKSADTGGFELVYKQPIGRRHLLPLNIC
jgi:hypothetical protein